ncbi:MAG: hypothetical protein RI894_1091 [Bacteroidota bacterium]|jgi:formylglycine-generating enzyme required for sulfatase activity
MQSANALQASNQLAKALVEFRNAQIAAGQCHISLIESTIKVKQTLEMIGKQNALAKEAQVKAEKIRIELLEAKQKGEIIKEKIVILEKNMEQAVHACDRQLREKTQELKDSLILIRKAPSSEQLAKTEALHKRLEELRLKYEEREVVIATQKDSVATFRKLLKDPTLRNNPTVDAVLIKEHIVKPTTPSQQDSIRKAKAAKELPNYTETAEKIDIPMIYVGSGSFIMGCNAVNEQDCMYDELPAHAVTIDSFFIGKTEVTQKQWRAVMGRNPAGLFFPSCDDCPVENVSWDDIQVFLRKLTRKTGKTYRLPTEAEWEFAARGGNKSAHYRYSGSNTIDEVAWSRNSSNQKTNTVASKKPNELGIYDMTGNVWEWCTDYFNRYPPALQTNPNDPNFAPYRVLRGGSWSNKETDCRIPYRNHGETTYRYGDNGFRIVRVP